MTDRPASPATAPQWVRRPDESMSLLVDLAAQALDPGYAEAAARRAATADGAAPANRHRQLAVVGVVVALAALLVVVAAVQAHRNAPTAAQTRAGLLAQVHKQNQAVAALQTRVQRLRDETTRLRDETLATSSAGLALSQRLSTEELVAGTVAAEGPGLRVTLDDEPGARGDNLVLDHDIQQVVNALWAAGAEAVAVDGQRLTAQSAIRQAGSAILVNFEPVEAPYEIVALGDPVAMETSFAASRAAARMRSLHQLYGLRFDYSREETLRVPPAPGLTVRFAQPAPARAGAQR